MKEKLMKKLENYQRLDAACDLALVVLVICGITICGGLEQGMMTIPTSLMLLAGVVIAAAIVLLVKRISWTQETTLANRIARRERWEESRDLDGLTEDELILDFHRYFSGEIPETVRSGRMLDRIELLEGESLDEAVEHWLYTTERPYIRKGGKFFFADNNVWKSIDAEVLKGEAIIFERVVDGGATA